MEIIINQEIENLNIDILTKAGMKKSTVNKLHKLKAKKLGDISVVKGENLSQLILEDDGISEEQLAELLDTGLVGFTRKIFASLKNDPVYDIVLLHISNHTHQEIAQRFGTSKDKVKQNISKFLQNIYTLVDALGNMLLENKALITMEDLQEVLEDENELKVLLLAFKEHDTKWILDNKAECIARK